MKKIENKELSIVIDGIERKSTYRELILQTLKYVPSPTQHSAGGISYDEMKKRDRIYEKCLDEKVEVIELEDEDHSNLCNLLRVMPWGINDKAIIQFCDYIFELKNNKS